MPFQRPEMNRLLRWAELAGFAAAAIVLCAFEISRHPEYVRQPNLILAFAPNIESTWVALAARIPRFTEGQLGALRWLSWSGIGLVIAGPVWWLVARKRCPPLMPPTSIARFAAQKSSARLLGAISLALFVLSVGMTWAIGREFAEMPPAFHDEYSYIFQAKTFLAGRAYFTPHSHSEFFDQMHVLNDDGVFASRYFPGVGLWLAPWVAIGRTAVGCVS